jgi:hypothetical protein
MDVAGATRAAGRLLGSVLLVEGGWCLVRSDVTGVVFAVVAAAGVVAVTGGRGVVGGSD